MKSIIEKASQIAKDNQQILFLCFLNLVMLEVIRSLFSSILFVGLIATIIMVPIGHAEAIFSLKVTRQMDGPLDPKLDSKVGLKQFKKLFIAYLFRGILSISFVFLICFPFLLIFDYPGFLNATLQTALQEAEYGISYTADNFFRLASGVISIAGFVVYFLEEWLFILLPFSIELEGERGLSAVAESFFNLKGHFFDAFKLVGYYFFFALFTTCLQTLVGMYVPSLLLSTILTIAIMIGQIYMYRMNYCVAKGLFYLEYYKKEEIQDDISDQ